MPILPFTDLSVRSLPEGMYFDKRTPSFGIRIGKHRKTWLVIKEPNRTKVRLGHYPDLSLSDARKRALIALGSPHEPSTTPTFSESLDQYLSQGQWRPRTAYETNRILKRYFHWTKALNKITHNDVAEVIDAIEANAEKEHAFKYLRTFFNWCVPRYLKSSPCAGLKSPVRYIPRERVLSDAELLKVWHTAISLGYPYGTICQLLILTGQRAGEIAALHWEWIDDNTITIPASHTKNRRKHRFPFGSMTKQLIQTIPLLGPLLFPARGYTDKPFQGFGVRKIALDACGVPNFTHHDLRRTYATNMAALGTPIHVVEKLLNHSSGTIRGVAAIYNRHPYFEEMKIAVAAYEKKLQSLFAR